jgi:hypothetical protein
MGRNGERGKAFFLVVVAVMVAGSSVALAGKGSISRISISGDTLAAPIEIRDPAIVSEFQIWAGPGTRSCVAGHCVEGTEGFIVDWSAGAVSGVPGGLRRYQVSFFVEEEPSALRPRSERLAYVVLYEDDPGRSDGFVYLPGKDDDWHEVNWGSIYRGGLEGNWFRATRAWQDLVVPLISRR